MLDEFVALIDTPVSMHLSAVACLIVARPMSIGAFMGSAADVVEATITRPSLKVEIF